MSNTNALEKPTALYYLQFMHTQHDSNPNFHRLALQFHLIQTIRDFFKAQNFLDVMTPPVVNNPGMETHIHPFQIRSALTRENLALYLHTSPEFQMKKLLSEGFENIFNISYCFRDEPDTPHHRKQFLMLEWYRYQRPYTAIMDDCERLISYCLEQLISSSPLSFPIEDEEKIPKLHNISFQRSTIQSLFEEFLHIDVLNFLDFKDIYQLIQKNYKDIPLPPAKTLSWDDCYFLLFLNKIEPHLANIPYILLYEFPHHLSALSTLKTSDPRVCERFEIYLNGIELCNCFNELTCLQTQKNRFEHQAQDKLSLYNYQLPEPTALYEALEKGLPPSSGIALGIERLLKALTNIENPFWE